MPAEPVSRLADLTARGIVPQLPPNAAPDLVNTLMEIGPIETAGMGAIALTWSTLGWWQEQNGVALPPWQLRLLRRLSADYLAETTRSAAAGVPSPWAEMTQEQRRKMVSDKVDQILGGLADAPPSGRNSKTMTRGARK